MFVMDGIPIGIFCMAGEFFALDDRCPHAGASLARGILDGDTVACRIRHWRFCLRDGTYLDESCRSSTHAAFRSASSVGKCKLKSELESMNQLIVNFRQLKLPPIHFSEK